ncbi:hypothetical protein C8A01DRAFT_17847 [Parachaetomium inaequale]|uniref:Uncharacterized protein n=1 Tax=Parachaetomium inaequale TaxID=2588326 RepID=A0AAN6SPP1_9PEZI|nr:hypothetical protein C8A01DRAFT_17847 [Parachaetomium inaequale]
MDAPWGRPGSSDAVLLLPEENPREARPTPVPLSGGDQQQSQYQQLEHQHQRQHHLQIPPPATQIPQPSPSPPTNTPSPDTCGKLSPGRVVESLARKLSKQNLRLNRSSHGHGQPQPASVDNPDLRRFQAWAEHAANRQPQHPQVPRHLPSPSDDRTIPWLALPMQHVGEPIEIDEEYVENMEEPDDRRLLDVRRPRRQTSSQLRASSRPVDQRLEGMIARGTQCNVHSEPRPTPTPAPSLPTPGSIPAAAEPAFIEPDPESAMAVELEADDTESGDMLEFQKELQALDDGSSIPLRYASGPGGIRKYTVGGVSLRYRLSADVALRCANVVRSRPRMRKRAKTRHGSAQSSALTSAVTSPALSSAPSPPLPPTRLPATRLPP